MRKRRTSLTIALLLVAGAFLWPGTFSVADYATSSASQERRPTGAAVAFVPAAEPEPESEIDVEREVIRSMVRRYRPGTDDSWRCLVADTVHREAIAAGMDPLMVAAIVAQESSFRTRAVSHAGAVGLMQIRPWVARDVVERRDELAVEWRGHETLHEPEANVRVGIRYFQELIDRFDGDHVTALDAYNRGPSRVSRELRSGEFAAGRYSRKVLGLYRELDALRASLDARGATAG